MTDDDRERRNSDLPADLKEEREAFVRQFLRRGFEVTEEVLAESRTLRQQLGQLREENAILRSHLASTDAIRDLVRKIDHLEGERRELLTRGAELEDSTKKSEERTNEVEQELHDLANLYIASSHLHATLSVRGVVRHMRELLQQLLGAERYAVYLLRENDIATVLVQEGLDDAPEVVVGEGAIGQAIAAGKSRIVEGSPQPAGTLESPLAVVPLRVRERVLGAIVVVSVFEQKERWAAVDHELLDLMGAQAGIALVSARLFANVSDARGLLVDLDSLLGGSTASVSAKSIPPGPPGSVPSGSSSSGSPAPSAASVRGDDV
jgi:nitrate/nitrite-specific signal transduction histidine kinase